MGNWGALAIRMHHSRFTIYGGIAMIRETAIAAAFLGFFGGGIAQAAYTVCRSQLDGREYLICAPESCFPGDRSVGYNPGKHPSCQSSRTQQDCGHSWTGWKNIGDATGSPCPLGCVRGEGLGTSIRHVGVPPRPQAKYKYQCWRQQLF